MDLIKKTREDYNIIAKHFAQTRAKLWPELLQFKAFLRNGQRVLDWGCGHGRLVELFEGFDIEYIGIDQSSAQINLAKEKSVPVEKKNKIKFFCTARGEKKFPKEYFDLVFMVASFFHLPDDTTRLALLKKTYNELKPGGHLIMTVWNLESAWAKRKQHGWKKIAKNDFLIPWKNQAGIVMAERYYHMFSPTELKKLLKDSGFKVQRLEFMSEAQSTDSKGGRNLVAVAVKQK